MLEHRIGGNGTARAAGRAGSLPLACCLLASVLAVAPAVAGAVSFEARVERASGPHAELFPAGAAVSIDYDLDSGAPDIEPDPRRGFFPAAVEFLAVSFPGLAIDVAAGPAGPVQTFDNAVTDDGSLASDQVFIFGGPVTADSVLGGEPIEKLEVDFLSDFVAPPAEPMMLDSDALPLDALPLTDAFVYLRTASGVTYVNLAAALPASGNDDDGCAIGRRDGVGFGSAWPLLVPTLVLWLRRRGGRGSPSRGSRLGRCRG